MEGTGPVARPGRPQRTRPANPAAWRAVSWRRWGAQTKRNTWSGSVQTCPAAVQGRQPSHCDEVLRSLDDTRVPLDNNQSERDLRMVKLQQKISGCWRTLAGAQAFLALRSYVSTARKQGMNPLAVLRQLFEGRPWLPTPVGS
jgi:Transposase IS66 family